jgi:four helix bundle protein
MGQQMKIESYRDLEVWQRAIDVAQEVYALTRRMPPQEQFGLASQLQRSLVSIASNIAEGFGRETTKDFIRYLTIARGSHMEVETQLTIAVRIHLFNRDDVRPVWNSLEQIAQMLNKLISSLRNRAKSRTRNQEPRTTKPAERGTSKR